MSGQPTCLAQDPLWNRVSTPIAPYFHLENRESRQICEFRAILARKDRGFLDLHALRTFLESAHVAGKRIAKYVPVRGYSQTHPVGAEAQMEVHKVYLSEPGAPDHWDHTHAGTPPRT